jgi:hypothetical protein
MSSFLTASSTNFKYNDYLSKCDLINKYSLKSVDTCPKLNKIVLEFSSLDVLSACETGNKKEWDSELQIKAFLLLYVLQANRPFINFNKVQINKDNSNYSVKLTFSGKEEIQSFLSQLFVENWNTLLLDDFEFIRLNQAKYNKYIQVNEKYVLNTKLPASSFVELDTLLNKNLFGITSKSLNIKASFLFENNIILKLKAPNLLIKNLPLFWLTNN